MLNLFTSVVSTLERQSEPVITDYDLTLLIYRLHQEANSEKTTPNNFTQSRKNIFNSIMAGLIDFNIIKRNKEFTGGTVYTIINNNLDDAFVIICAVDPFVYISHLSAMKLYGITEMSSQLIYITEPQPNTWIDLADAKRSKDQTLYSDMPKLHKICFNKVSSFKIIKYTDKNYGDFTFLKNSNVRITSLGRTFLDMIRKPDYAGTMQHVLDVYMEYGPQYSDLIIEQIDKYGSPIEKVRAGFILDECCKIRNPIIDSWTKFCQRGGSRKLDPSKEYKSKFSEKWCLSINL